MGDNVVTSVPTPACVDKGTVRLSIARLDALANEKKTKESETSTIAGLPWTIFAASEKSERTGKKRYLSVGVYCNKAAETTLQWSCSFSLSIVLLAKNGKAMQRVEEVKFVANETNHHLAVGYSDFYKWSDLVSAKYLWTLEKATEVVVEIRVTKLEGFSFGPIVGPELSKDAENDGVLVIGKCRMQVNKEYLAACSSVFNILFFGALAQADETPIEDVDYVEFANFIRAIHPPRLSINDGNVTDLLELAWRFDVRFLLSDCEEFLLRTTRIQSGMKLYLAEKYQFVRLHDAVLRSATTIYNLLEVAEDDLYASLMRKTKLALFEKAATFPKKTSGDN